MRQFKEVKKEILDFIDSYREKRKTNVHAEITQLDNQVQLAIFEDIRSGSGFFGNPTPKVKKLSLNEFLHLNNQEIHTLITNIIEEDDESPFLGPRINV